MNNKPEYAYRMKLYRKLEKEFSPETAQRLITFMKNGGDQTELLSELEKNLSPEKARQLLNFLDNITPESLKEIMEFIETRDFSPGEMEVIKILRKHFTNPEAEKIARFMARRN